MTTRLLVSVALLAASTSTSAAPRQAWRWKRSSALFGWRGGSAAPTTPVDGKTTTTNDTSLLSHDGISGNATSQPLLLPKWKQALPELLQKKGPKTLQKINLAGAEIYLLGTAHVSNDSSADVKLLLEAVEPDCIFVELCEARIGLLEGDEKAEDDQATADTPERNNTVNVTAGDEPAPSFGKKKKETKPDFWDRLDTIRQSQGGSRLQALSTLLLTSVQEDYAETLGVELGGEFHAAHRYWKEACHGSKDQATRKAKPSLVLGDRPLSLTLVRAWESLWWWPKTKVIGGLLWSSLHKPNPDEIRAWLEAVLREESDVLTESLQELRQAFPSLHATIIAERDSWLAAKLVQTCRILTATGDYSAAQTSGLWNRHVPPRRRIVAIVGAGHVPGIVQWLTNSTASASPEEILRNLTATKRWAKDGTVQNEMIPMWVNEVTQVHQYQEGEFEWADPSTATPP